MSKIDSLALGTSLDLGGLTKGFDAASEMVDQFLNSSASRLQGIQVSPASIDMSSGSKAADDLTSQADAIRGAFLPLGSQLTQSLAGASAPIRQMIERFLVGFEEVGPVVEKLAIRIDSAMRFPAIIKRIEGVRDAFGKWTFGAGKDAVKLKSTVDATVGHQADASVLVGSFEKARVQIKRAVKPIPGDVGYALEAAGHVDARASFATYLKGLDEVKSAAIDKMRAMADAIAHPGRGSRKGVQARARASDLASRQGAVPPRDNTTPGAKPYTPIVPTSFLPPILDRKIGDSTAAINEFNRGLKLAQFTMKSFVTDPIRNVLSILGSAPNLAAKTYLSFTKVSSAVSSMGSIAGATFQKISGLKIPKFSIDSRNSAVLKGIGGAATSATGNVKSLIGNVAAAAGFFSASYVAIDFLKDGIKGASDLNETLSKTRNVLGAASPAVESFADTMASRFGLVKGDTLDLAASLGGLAKGLGGLKGESLAGFSKQFTSLAADVSSLSNIDLKSAGDALRTGLSGNQSDVLKGMGAVMTEEAVDAKAYAAGIAQVGEKLSESQKFAARALVIQEALNKLGATGDLERTADGTANQYRKLTGTISNLATSVGAVLLPVVNAGISVVGDLVSQAASAFEASKETIMGWVDVAVDGFDVVSSVVNNWPAAFEVASLIVTEKLAQIGDWLDAFGKNAEIVGEYLSNNWVNLILDGFNAIGRGIINLYRNFFDLGISIVKFMADPTKGFKFDWTSLSDGFVATADKFPELIKPTLTDLSKEIGNAMNPITDDLAARRAKRASDKLKPPVVGKDAAEDAEAGEEGPAEGVERKRKTLEIKSAGADEVGTKEGYSAVVRSIHGRAEGMEEVSKSGKKTANNTGKLVDQIKGLRREMGNAKQPQLVI